jgi:DNA-directed RNA polymerase subunit N (RpoN/RPB10)
MDLRKTYIPPLVCFSCGKYLNYIYFLELQEQQEQKNFKEIFYKMDIYRVCCKTTLKTSFFF